MLIAMVIITCSSPQGTPQPIWCRRQTSQRWFDAQFLQFSFSGQSSRLPASYFYFIMYSWLAMREPVPDEIAIIQLPMYRNSISFSVIFPLYNISRICYRSSPCYTVGPCWVIYFIQCSRSTWSYNSQCTSPPLPDYDVAWFSQSDLVLLNSQDAYAQEYGCY